MKLSELKIIDNNDILHQGASALSFIKNNCSISIGLIPRMKNSICLDPEKEKKVVNAEEITKALLDCLRGKIKSLKTSLGGQTGRANIPSSRRASNKYNVSRAKLNIEVIYKGSSPIKFFQNPIITAEVLHEASKTPVKEKTQNGRVCFDKMTPNKYKVTLDYSQLDECKYDCLDKTREVYLEEGSEVTLIFQVEPLYQKVQLIAHCILAVPDYKFVLTDEDKKKVDVTTEPSGKQIFAYKTGSVQDGFYKADDLFPKFPIARIKTELNPDDGGGTLTLKQYKLPDEYYQLAEITLDKDVIERTEVRNQRQPHVHDIIFKPTKNLHDVKLSVDDAEKAGVSLGKIILKKKPEKLEYMSRGELENLINQNSTKIEIIKQSINDPNVYEIQFKPKIKDVTFTKKDLKGGWMGQYHGLEDDKADMTERINLVKATLELAYKKAKDDPLILKVFMIPECFFQGRYGAYRVEDADYLFSGLLKLVGDVKWKDWIFVFGTVNLTYGEDIREMMNYSPVIRGGLGSADKRGSSGGESDERLRLIQKLVNSAELLDDNQIIHHAKETRIPAINDTVQFQPTENEEKVGYILKKLLAEEPDFGERHGLKKEYWEHLKTEFLKKERELGLTRVVRLIRGCQVAETPTTLSGWVSGYEDIVMAHMLPSMCMNVTWKRIIYSIINTAWDKYCKENLSVSVPPDCNEDWGEIDEPGPTRRTSVLTDIRDRLDVLAARFGIIVPSQKDILRAEIQTLLDDDAAAIKYYCEQVQIRPVKIVPPEIPLNFRAGVYPMWKNILMFYCAEKKLDEGFLTPKDENMNYRDYCFAARRKAGPWVSLDEVKSLDPCKKLIFGLEICADHAAGRLKKLVQQPVPESLPITAIAKDREFREIKINEIKEENKKKANVTIDIQLLPSAGMFPGSEYVVARKNGYLFNCDGWNKGQEKGVNVIEEWFNGPKVEADNENKMANPVTPHTAIAKGGGGSLDMEKFKPERIKLETEIIPAPDKNILNKAGLGELHIYEELDLPN